MEINVLQPVKKPKQPKYCYKLVVNTMTGDGDDEHKIELLFPKTKIKSLVAQVSMLEAIKRLISPHHSLDIDLLDIPNFEDSKIGQEWYKLGGEYYDTYEYHYVTWYDHDGLEYNTCLDFAFNEETNINNIVKILQK